MKTAWIPALAAVGLAACQSVQSRHVDFGSGEIAHGLQYAAPKALMKVELVAYQNALTLNLSQPFLIGDPEATYALSTTASPFSDNRYVFLVNPQTRLLTYVNAETTGRAGEILKKLAESIGAVQAKTVKPGDETSTYLLNAAVPTTIFSTIIDPMKGCTFGQKMCAMTELNGQLHARAMTVLGCATARTPDAETLASEKARGVEGSCRMLRSRPDYFNITLEPMFEVTGNTRASPANCNSSICYRAPAPYLLGAHVGDVTDESRLIMMPNKSPILALDLPAGVFATAKSRVDLVHGMPATVAIDQKSEVLEVVAIPLNLIDSFFTSFSKIVSLRVNYDTSRNNVIDSTIRREDKEAAYAERKKAAAAKLAAAEKELEATRAKDLKKDFVDDPEAQQRAIQEDENAVKSAKEEVEKVAEGGADAVGGGSDETRTFSTLFTDIPDAQTDAQAMKAAQEAPVTTISIAADQNLMTIRNVTCPDKGCPGSGGGKAGDDKKPSPTDEPKEDADRANAATSGNK